MRTGRIIIKILAATAFIAAAIFGIYAYKAANTYSSFDTSYEEIAEEYTDTAEIVVVETTDPGDILIERDIFPFHVDFDRLLNADEHVIGWIYLEDSPINYPVMKWTDNTYYLSHGMNGMDNTYGAIFADAGNMPDFSDASTVLYGHHMNNGSGFAEVAKYKEQEYFDENPVMWLSTPTADYRIDIYSCYITKPDSDSYRIRFKDTEDYAAWLHSTIDDSIISAEVSPSVSTRVITLSTCSYEFDGARCVVHGILTEV